MLLLDAHGYRVTLAPAHGATLLTADWQHPDGRRIALLAPLADPTQGLKAGCFIMAPFANRIAAGRFTFEGEQYQVPVNRPEENMAIHGYSRTRSWQVLAKNPDYALLVDEVDGATLSGSSAKLLDSSVPPEAGASPATAPRHSAPGHTPAANARHTACQRLPGIPWHYRIEQHIRLSETGISIRLCLRNDGDASLPFGLGLHPWFPLGSDTTLDFAAAGHFPKDASGLPAGQCQAHPQLGQGSAATLTNWRGMDLCFTGWQPRQARIAWPDQQAGLLLSAQGALRHLHVYVTPDRDVFCTEPVSHLPDAINRAALGPDAAMTVLAPGASMEGEMHLSAFALARSAPPLNQKLPHS